MNYLTEQRIFIIARILLSVLFFKYFFDLILDRDFVFFSFTWAHTSTLAMAIGITGSVLSLLLGLGILRRWASGLLCLLLLSFIYFSQFSGNVSLGYLSFLLLVMVFVPAGESWNSARDWKFPQDLMWVLWIVTGISYLESGIDKLRNPYWSEGIAINQLLNFTIAANDNFLTDFIKKHAILGQIINWYTIAVDLAFGLFFVFSKARWVLWMMMVALHIGVLLTMQIYYISFGMLIFHFFLVVDKEFIFSKKANII